MHEFLSFSLFISAGRPARHGARHTNSPAVKPEIQEGGDFNSIWDVPRKPRRQQCRIIKIAIYQLRAWWIGLGSLHRRRSECPFYTRGVAKRRSFCRCHGGAAPAPAGKKSIKSPCCAVHRDSFIFWGIRKWRTNSFSPCHDLYPTCYFPFFLFLADDNFGCFAMLVCVVQYL